MMIIFVQGNKLYEKVNDHHINGNIRIMRMFKK